LPAYIECHIRRKKLRSPDACGAIKGAADNAKQGNLTAMLESIRPSLKKLNDKGVPSSKDKALVQKLAD
jgi:carbonic anhydrase